MGIRKEIVSSLKDKNLDTWRRILYRVILGEFDRINDGKPITEEESISVIKKMVKNSKEILKYKPLDPIATREVNELETFLPKMADKELMKKVIQEVFEGNEFKNKMQSMNPCVIELEKLGYNVDKSELSKMVEDF